MGEIADAMLKGSLCMECGLHLDFSKESTEKIFDLYGLTLHNTHIQITREDLELMPEDQVTEFKKQLSRKGAPSTEIVDWYPYGTPLLCEDCSNDYIQESRVYKIKQRIVMNMTFYVRGCSVDEAENHANLCHKIAAQESENDHIHFVEAKILDANIAESQEVKRYDKRDNTAT